MKILYNEEDTKFIEDQTHCFILTTFNFLDKIMEIMNINEEKINQPYTKEEGPINQHGWQGKEIKTGGVTNDITSIMVNIMSNFIMDGVHSCVFIFHLLIL